MLVINWKSGKIIVPFRRFLVGKLFIVNYLLFKNDNFNVFELKGSIETIIVIKCFVIWVNYQIPASKNAGGHSHVTRISFFWIEWEKSVIQIPVT